MPPEHFGSCLCRAISYKVQGVFERFFLCHCSRCRKDTGSAHSANLFSPTARIQWLCGEDKVQTFTLPGTRHTHAFCPICGSALPHLNSGFLVVRAGSLDSELAMTPQAHVFTGSSAAWDQALATLLAFDGLPS